LSLAFVFLTQCTCPVNASCVMTFRQLFDVDSPPWNDGRGEGAFNIERQKVWWGRHGSKSGSRFLRVNQLLEVKQASP